MISISQLAAFFLCEALQESKIPEEQGLRLIRGKEGLY
jgi:hypothetical protein